MTDDQLTALLSACIKRGVSPEFNGVVDLSEWFVYHLKQVWIAVDVVGELDSSTGIASDWELRLLKPLSFYEESPHLLIHKALVKTLKSVLD